MEDKVAEVPSIKMKNDATMKTSLPLGQANRHTNGTGIALNGKSSDPVNDQSVGQPVLCKGHPCGHRGCSTRNGKSCNYRRMRRLKGWRNWLTLACGMCVGVFVGSTYAWFLYILHENRLWFTHIKEVEREISFRTESGLYYSYYKQFLNAPTISEAFYELTHDNITENWRTINVLQRFNIYQEVFLAVLFRLLPSIQSHFLPIFFYINTVFALHGVYFTALFVTAWLLSNSWLAGLMACTFFIANREDVTRVDFTIPLRESFALPFLYIQMACITYYLRPAPHSNRQAISLAVIAASTFLFVLTWQFAQFILVLQAMALYFGAIAGLIPTMKVTNVFITHLGSILMVCILQFLNKMLLGSLAVSFVICALLDFRLQMGRPVVTGIFAQLLTLIGRLVFTCAGMFILSIGIKVIIGLDADQHIFKFLTAKLGLAHARDFDVLLYKCHGAFSVMSMEVFQRLTSTFLFPIYIAVVFGLLSVLIVAIFQKWSEESEMSARKKDDDHDYPSTSTTPPSSPPPQTFPASSPYGILRKPDLAYHTIQTILFGLMALLVVRMKFVWTPQMCILAAYGICNGSLWRWLLDKMGYKSETIVQCVRHSVTIVIIAILIWKCYPQTSEELSSLREFYDPDTVELMNWISQQTPKTAVFSGSMQLLAGVKLCTGRRLTNHPHYEDKQLRDKTLELYQYYARRSAKDVFDIHNATGTDYIILEDSICHARSSEVGCRLPDILDIMNGHLYTGANHVKESKLKPPNTQRFCDAIKQGSQEYTRFFRLVFHNRTFRVYQLVQDRN